MTKPGGGLISKDQAKSLAESNGGTLATITTQEEQSRLEEMLDEQISLGLATRDNFWIGAIWTNNSLSWDSGESSSYENFYHLGGYPKDSTNFPTETGVYLALNSNPPNPQTDYKWINSNPSNGMGGYVLETSIHLLDLPWSDLHASIQQVANARAQNGAEQMRLQMEADLNATNTINLESALSRIQDVDIAEESATLARSRVLQQAGTAMLAQANQSSQSILKLIQMN
jgi:flagellin-like hook-associated protein FlgL